MRNINLASAIALALGGATAAHAALPTTAQCAAPQNGLYVAGSSAAQNAFGAALATDLFGGAANEVTFSASNGNFKAYCGFAAAGNTAGVPAGNVVTIHYRGEGGSVVGALPIVSGKAIKFLDLTVAPAVAGNTVAVPTTGTSAANGTNDSWGGDVVNHAVEVGITDVEPAQFHNDNYPSAYNAAVFGSATTSQLAGLTKVLLFQQVFGLFVNTTGINGGAAGQAINIGKDTAANILNGNYADWNSVPQYGVNAPVSNVSAPITLVNRESGSGSRTGASIYFLNYGCPGLSPKISDPTPANDGYATGDVLTTANATNGAITYASIDNNGAKPNLTMVSIDGVTPSNLNSALGGYGWFFEATMIKGAISSPGGAGLYTWLSGGELSSVTTGPHLADNNAIAGLVAANTATVPLTSNTLATKTIYVSDFSRGGNSCSLPVEQN